VFSVQENLHKANTRELPKEGTAVTLVFERVEEKPAGEAR
jgi:hypothetical protein